MGTIGSIISWVVFGLVIGLIARLLYPGRQPMGLLTTMVLGIVGSLVGGFISWGLGFRPEEGAFRGAGWIMSIVGALIVVWVSLYLSSRSTPGTRVP
ncbi:MAG: GlsB/YeaQ/YmgE family stress response membrane protein [Pirellulaceae bacterium]